MRFFKDKNSRNFIFGILGIICIFIFPPIWILFLTVAVFVIFFEAVNSNQTSIKEIAKDSGYYAKRANAIRDAWQGRFPRTFYEVIGDLGNHVWFYYNKELYNPKKITNENKWLIDQFEWTKNICDDFFDGQEYIKYWTIYRSLERRGVSEQDLYNAFPNLSKEIKKIREQNWEDIAWYWACADKVDEINKSKDSCTKELLQKSLKFYDQKVRKKFLENLTDEEKNEYKLLTVLDIEKERKKDKEIVKEIWKKMPDTSNLGRQKPKRISSSITWSLEDAVKFGELIWGEYFDLGLPEFNGFGKESEIIRKKEQFSGNLVNDQSFKNFLGNEITKYMQDFDRVRDFFKFEKYDPDPIQTAIKNEDIERIIFYSLIEIPQKTLLSIAWDDQVFITEPTERAPYFAIAKIHMFIILQVMEHLKVYDDKEIDMKLWILNRITDPLDKGETSDQIISKAMKDERFMKEIWWGLYRLLEMNFLSSKGLIGDVEEVFSIVDSFFPEVLNNYFLKDPEDAYALIAPLNKTLDE